jgi:predicted amidohydrolase
MRLPPSYRGLRLDRVTLFLRVYPSRQQYRLPEDESAGEIIKSLAEVLGNRGCVVLGYELPDQADSNAVVLINGNTVDCVEVVDVPDARRRRGTAKG